MGWLTESALKNLELNSEALHNKYVVEEGYVRSRKQSNLDDTMLGSPTGRTGMASCRTISNRSLMQRSKRRLKPRQQVAGYVNAVQQRALQSSMLVADTENKATAADRADAGSGFRHHSARHRNGCCH